MSTKLKVFLAIVALILFLLPASGAIYNRHVQLTDVTKLPVVGTFQIAEKLLLEAKQVKGTPCFTEEQAKVLRNTYERIVYGFEHGYAKSPNAVKEIENAKTKLAEIDEIVTGSIEAVKTGECVYLGVEEKTPKQVVDPDQ